LPRGFGFLWEDFDDRNLLQLAYDLDYTEYFLAGDKEYVNEGGPPLPPGVDRAIFHSWETKTIFKDNDLQRDYRTGELVSVVSGAGVRVIQPPFTIVPFEDLNNCVAFGDPQSNARIIERVPFAVAIPMLTGWDLSYVCDDQRVEEIGIRIDPFEYTAAGYAGMLTYTVHAVLHDENGGDAERFRHRVGILGFNRTP